MSEHEGMNESVFFPFSHLSVIKTHRCILKRREDFSGTILLLFCLMPRQVVTMFMM